MPALAVADRTVCDYATLAARVARFAGAFGAAGLRPGERVAIISRNTTEYVEALFGCWWAGLAAVPVNARLHPRELAFILADSGARWALIDADWQATIKDAATDADALERILLLGGTEYSRLLDAVLRD